MRAALARRTASMITSSSMRFSLAGGQVGWTMNTSSPRTLSSIRTPISPSAYLKTLIAPSGRSRAAAIPRARSGLLVPLKTRIPAPVTGAPLSPTVEDADHAGRNPDHDAAGRNVFRHHRAGAGDRPPANPDRGDQHRVAPDVRPVPDGRPVLPVVEAVVARHRPRADVDIGADPGVAQVTLVVDLGAIPHVDRLHLGEIADLDVPPDDGARPQMRVGAHDGPVAHARSFER